MYQVWVVITCRLFAKIVGHVKWTDDVSLLACILLGLRFWLKEVFFIESVSFTYHDVDSIDCARDAKNKRVSTISPAGKKSR